MTGLYIHIPFCASRCIYCGFYSTTLSRLKDEYVNSLILELETRRNEISEGISTIYLGGGTPSLISISQICSLFGHIKGISSWEQDAEITMECNPEDITEEFVKGLTYLPVNRISMGAQTFDDDRLRFLHRRHTSKQVHEAVDRLRSIGMDNISLDLMFGFPNESISQWSNDIQECLSLGVEHISAYSLMYEEGTPLYSMLQEGKVAEITDEESLKMYDTLCDTLTAAGYEHYEISNFARPKFRSRHNSSYWTGKKYVGIGTAAHSYDIKSRSWNVSDLRRYIAMTNQGMRPLDGQELIDESTRYDDTVTTALRTKEGINLSEVNPRFRSYLLKEAERFIDAGQLKLTDNHLRLTRKGIYISDGIMAELMCV